MIEANVKSRTRAADDESKINEEKANGSAKAI